MNTELNNARNASGPAMRLRKSAWSMAKVALVLTGLCIMAASVNAQIINVNFLGRYTSDVPWSPNYVGTGAVGSGTVFNPIYIDSQGGAVNVTTLNMLDMNGAATTVGLTMNAVSGGQYGATDTTPSTDILALNGTGLFNDNGLAGFVLTGLSGVTVDLYVYGRFDGFPMPVLQLNGATEPLTPSSFTPVAPYSTTWVTYYQNVTVTDGAIVGTFGEAGGQIWTGLTVSVVPEPSTTVMLMVAGVFVAFVIRRKRVVS